MLGQAAYVGRSDLAAGIAFGAGEQAAQAFGEFAAFEFAVVIAVESHHFFEEVVRAGPRCGAAEAALFGRDAAVAVQVEHTHGGGGGGHFFAGDLQVMIGIDSAEDAQYLEVVEQVAAGRTLARRLDRDLRARALPAPRR